MGAFPRNRTRFRIRSPTLNSLGMTPLLYRTRSRCWLVAELWAALSCTSWRSVRMCSIRASRFSCSLSPPYTTRWVALQVEGTVILLPYMSSNGEYLVESFRADRIANMLLHSSVSHARRLSVVNLASCCPIVRCILSTRPLAWGLAAVVRW